MFRRNLPSLRSISSRCLFVSEGAFLYNAYTGAVYEVAAYCHDEDIPVINHVGTFSYLAGCMFKAPVRDTYNQPAALNPFASGVP